MNLVKVEDTLLLIHLFKNKVLSDCHKIPPLTLWHHQQKIPPDQQLLYDSLAWWCHFS